jgi:hypothetical protein
MVGAELDLDGSHRQDGHTGPCHADTGCYQRIVMINPQNGIGPLALPKSQARLVYNRLHFSTATESLS